MKKIVLFLHGYGSNGSDLISLKDYISLDHSSTEFISPNAPEPCELNFFGYQWFPLKDRSSEELKLGLNSAFKYLDDIIKTIIEKQDIDASQISIIGFSQGSMLATYYALQKNYNFNSIISLSGSLPKEILETLNLVKNSSQYLIFHGKADDVVSFEQAIQTHNFLIDNKIIADLILDENCAHSVSPLALKSINKLYKSWI
tara:strand:+ start:6639 stop:7241 length:603 start_codon:yes stop_codon:yes gene_type:complete